MKKKFTLLMIAALALLTASLSVQAQTPPTITTTVGAGGTVGTAYSQTLAATGDAPITWAVTTGSLPAGLTLSTAGVISGTPTTEGSSQFRVTATNSAGSDSKTLGVLIRAAEAGTPPSITTTVGAGGTIGAAYNQTLAATGTAPITWAVTYGSLPAGLTLSTDGVISGTPTTAGSSIFHVTATNSAGSDTKALSILIAAAGTPPSITTSSLPSGTSGSAYSTTLAAIATPPITWSLTSGSLPAGLTLSTAGVISGTPTATGTFGFTVTASNSAGTDAKALSIVISSETTPPTPSVTPPSMPGSAALPSGSAGSAYNESLNATGSLPMTWTLVSGSLPPGLTLSPDGTISGTPTQTGTYAFTVSVSNSAGTATSVITIVISPPVANEAISAETFIAYPNPTDGKVTINGLTAGGTVRVYNSFGILVNTYKATDSVLKIDISNLSKGMYMFNYEGQTVKVIKR